MAAEETDAGHYTPGAAATIIDLPPTKPGFVIQPIGLHYRGDVSVSNDFPIAGTVAAGLEAQADVVTLGALYTFERAFSARSTPSAPTCRSPTSR